MKKYLTAGQSYHPSLLEWSAVLYETVEQMGIDLSEKNNVSWKIDTSGKHDPLCLLTKLSVKIRLFKWKIEKVILVFWFFKLF